MMIYLLLILFTSISFAEPILYGIEPTFTNKLIDKKTGLRDEFVKEVYDAQKEMRKIIIEKCKKFNCEESIIQGKYNTKSYRYLFKDGFWFQVSVDVSAIEIQTSPFSLSYLKKNEQLLQDIIWDSAAAANLKPDALIGGGHINIDAKTAFKNDLSHFKNYLIDYQNQYYINKGFLDFDDTNGPMIRDLGEEAYSAWENLVKKKHKNIKSLSQDIIENIYIPYGAMDVDKEKYHSVNLSSYLQDDESLYRLEHRSYRAQETASELRLELEMLENKIKTTKDKIYAPRPFVKKYSTKQAAVHFFEYLQDADLEFKKYNVLISNQYRKVKICDALMTLSK